MDMDLSSAIFADLTSFYVDGHWAASGSYIDAMFPTFEVNPTSTYTVSITYHSSQAGNGSFFLFSSISGDAAGFSNSSWSELAVEGPATLQDGTIELTMGPGLGAWDAAMAAGERFVIFEIGSLGTNGYVSGVSIVDQSGGAAPSTPNRPTTQYVGGHKASLRWGVPTTGPQVEDHEVEVNGVVTLTGSPYGSTELTGLTLDTNYVVRVRSISATGTPSEWSAPYSFRTLPVSPNALLWNAPEERFFETGLDRGVLYPRNGTPVPWNGLVGVDEEGGESAAAYYIDGRPFLYLPRIKEYKATLKAYTYPDAFAEIMGMAEVADGLYLDSQMGGVFDLSYRTLVGNSIDGIDHGYKIHLVYNATIAPQSTSYESLSSSINPTTFSWEIQAVPVRVDGFNPTAHITIDTRHLDSKKIAAVEALVYGNEITPVAMPTPQAVFDLLSFGDTIIVTDNGDGTFDVTGSYENVYMIGEGVFRVDNIDGTNNGDGTFTISSTGE